MTHGECFSCGCTFPVWEDQYGEEITDMCKDCDDSYLEGMIEDRDRES